MFQTVTLFYYWVVQVESLLSASAFKLTIYQRNQREQVTIPITLENLSRKDNWRTKKIPDRKNTKKRIPSIRRSEDLCIFQNDQQEKTKRSRKLITLFKLRANNLVYVVLLNEHAMKNNDLTYQNSFSSSDCSLFLVSARGATVKK